MERVLIVGCGYVGSALAERLVSAGRRVWGLRRSSAVLPSGVEPLRADLGDAATLSVVPQQLDSVVYAAGPGAPDEASYRRAYVEGLANLLEIFEKRGFPQRILFTSSTSVYGQRDGELVDETSPTRPSRFAGRVLLEAEARLADVPTQTAVLRLGGIYGPGRIRLLTSVLTGAARCRTGAPHYTNRIHRDDAAGALEHLLGLETLLPVYLGVDDEPGEESEVLRFIARELGVAEPAREDVSTPRRAGSKRCSNQRLKGSGYPFQYPSYREGYAALVRESRDPGVSPETR